MWEIQKKQTERGNVIVEKTYLPNTISGPCLDPSSNKVPIKGDSFFLRQIWKYEHGSGYPMVVRSYH